MRAGGYSAKPGCCQPVDLESPSMFGWWDHFWDAPDHRPEWTTLLSRRLAYRGFFFLLGGWLMLWVSLAIFVGGSKTGGWIGFGSGAVLMLCGLVLIAASADARDGERGTDAYESWANRPSPAYRGWVMAGGMVVGSLAPMLKLFVLSHHLPH